MALFLQQTLEIDSKKPLRLKINDNHSTMLSVKWEQNYTKVSLHRMFLTAPQHVMESLSCYLNKKQKGLPETIKFFIEENVKHLDYSSLLNKEKFVVQGTVFNIKKIYDELNSLYFDNKLNLEITWFGKNTHKKRNRVTLGLYHTPLKLIKIHRILDNPSIPSFLIEYVIYHEMLHCVYPSYHDATGMHRIHTVEFKEREKQHRYYKTSQNWIKNNQDYLFKGLF